MVTDIMDFATRYVYESCDKILVGTMITCECGFQLPRGTRFCTSCGKNVQQDAVKIQPNVPAVTVPAASMKQCICGAQIQKGQFMYIECGRRAE